MAWSSNMQVIENTDNYILVSDEWSKWLRDNQSGKWRTFLNEWRKCGYKKVKYLIYKENELHEDSGTYFHPIEVFEKASGLKYRDRCTACHGTGYVWKITP